MVARFVWLKWRLLINGLRHDKQRMIGFPILMAFISFGSFALATRYMDTAESLEGAALTEFSLWCALLAWIAWTTLPVLLFPIDESLSPAKFSLQPVSPRNMVAGLTAAGVVTPPIIVPLVLVAANLGVFAATSGLVMAIISSVVLVILMVMSTQVFSAAVTAVLRTRFGRDAIFLLIGSLGFGVFYLQQRIATVTGELGVGAASLAHPLSNISWLLPPVAAQNAITKSAAGEVGGALASLAAALVWIVIIGWAWSKVVDWLITTPEAPLRESTTSSRGLLGRRRWSSVAAVTAKELRFYVRDPRMRMVWTGGVVFLGIIGASLLVGSAQLEVIRRTPALTLTAPAIVLFVGLPVALNQFGWERNAASFLFALPVTVRQLMMGKNIASATALVIEASLLSVIFAAVSGGWGLLWFAPFLIVTAILCQLAVGNVVSTLTPMRLPPVGTDLFAQATEQGCLALISQMSAFATIAVLMIPPATAFSLMSAFGVNALRLRILFIAGSLLWGVALYAAGLWLGTRILDRRLPEMVSAVQTL